MKQLIALAGLLVLTFSLQAQPRERYESYRTIAADGSILWVMGLAATVPRQRFLLKFDKNDDGKIDDSEKAAALGTMPDDIKNKGLTEEITINGKNPTQSYLSVNFQVAEFNQELFEIQVTLIAKSKPQKLLSENTIERKGLEKGEYYRVQVPPGYRITDRSGLNNATLSKDGRFLKGRATASKKVIFTFSKR